MLAVFIFLHISVQNTTADWKFIGKVNVFLKCDHSKIFAHFSIKPHPRGNIKSYLGHVDTPPATDSIFSFY